jgi:tetratricopeptide (TPR) repeat protein
MDKSPESLAGLAKKSYQAGKFTTASDLFLQAQKDYQAAGDKLMAAEMGNNRSVALLQAGDAQSSFDACKGTHTVFAKAGDTLREGFALGNQAAALKELGQKKESLKLYRLSAARLEKAGDKENLAIVHKTIASLEMEEGDKFGAMSAMLDALRAKEKLTLREKFMRKLFALASRLLPK